MANARPPASLHARQAALLAIRAVRTDNFQKMNIFQNTDRSPKSSGHLCVISEAGNFLFF